MRTIRIVFILIAFLTLQKSFSQSNFKPGYIISNSGDTLSGLIDYRGDIKNSNSCVYKADEKSKIVTYKPGDIRAYWFIEGKYYISRTIQINNLSITRFIEFLVDGIANLYYYKDSWSDHYLIEKDDGRILELTNEEKEIFLEDERKFVMRSNRHIGILKATFRDCNEIQRKVNNAKLTHKSLINIVKDYHSYICKDEECIVYEKKLSLITIRITPFVGYNISWIRYFMDETYSPLDFEYSFNPSLGLILNTMIPSVNEKITLQFEAEAGKYYFYGYHKITETAFIEHIDYHIHALFLKNLISLKYTYPKGKFRPTASIGGGIHSIIKNSSRRVSELELKDMVYTNEFHDIPLDKISICGSGTLGVNYYWNNKRYIFFALHYNYISEKRTETFSRIQNIGIKGGVCF
ncbi:MAG: hypothetical protein JW973_13375 [Bacteroidales bacterium]|nr:hypothetical protein [Bacteroidales bacterium]